MTPSGTSPADPGPSSTGSFSSSTADPSTADTSGSLEDGDAWGATAPAAEVPSISGDFTPPIASAPAPGARMTYLNPAGMHTPPGYHHVTVVEAGRTAYLAGQCPVGPDDVVVGDGDLAAQVDQVVANAEAALAAVGARPRDVVRSVIYVVSDSTPVLGEVWDRLTGSAIGPAFRSASTLLGVTRLGFTGQLVEVDLTAALPE